MRRRLVLGLILLAAVSAQQPSLRGQLSSKKKKLFLKAREDIEPVPKATVTPRPKPKAAPTPTPSSRATPTATPRVTPGNRHTPAPRPNPRQEPRAITPRPTPAVAPTPRKQSREKDRSRSPRSLLRVATPDVIPLESPETPAPTPPQIPRGKTPLGERLEAPISLRSQDWKRTRDSSRLRDEEVGSSDGDA